MKQFWQVPVYDHEGHHPHKSVCGPLAITRTVARTSHAAVIRRSSRITSDCEPRVMYFRRRLPPCQPRSTTPAPAAVRQPVNRAFTLSPARAHAADGPPAKRRTDPCDTRRDRPIFVNVAVSAGTYSRSISAVFPAFIWVASMEIARSAAVQVRSTAGSAQRAATCKDEHNGSTSRQ
jgi:hypothetical protein